MSNRGRHKKVVKSALDSYTKENLGKLKNLPDSTIIEILDERERQTGRRDLGVLPEDPTADQNFNGFTWSLSIKGHYYWYRILTNLF